MILTNEMRLSHENLTVIFCILFAKCIQVLIEKLNCEFAIKTSSAKGKPLPDGMR